MMRYVYLLSAPPGYRSVLRADKAQRNFTPNSRRSGVPSTATKHWLAMTGPCFDMGRRVIFIWTAVSPNAKLRRASPSDPSQSQPALG